VILLPSPLFIKFVREDKFFASNSAIFLNLQNVTSNITYLAQMTNLTERLLISNLELIEKKVSQLELINIDNSKWTKTYFDKNENEKWLSYYVDSYQHGGGYNILGKLPIPTCDELIEIALNTEHDDELFASCRTLVENETNEDFRLTLINKLELHKDKRRQLKIIELTGLNSELNLKETLGKTIEQIKKDSKYFWLISERAKKLLNN
jgi:hypothetical protein